MTKAELEQKIVGLVKAQQIGQITPMQAYSQQCNILADYFADTSCNPPLQVAEVAGIVIRQNRDHPDEEVQVLAQRGDGQYFEIAYEPPDGSMNHEVTAAGIAKIFESGKPVA